MPALLAVIAHPDDESYSFGGTLALAARAGWRCLVVSVTSGEGGKRHDGGPSGNVAVGLAREAELAASCAILGVEPPQFWRLPDGHVREQRSQAPRLQTLIESTCPDIILSLGEDGAYGHPDHIAVYRWLLEAWRSLQALRPPLLLAAFPRGLFVPQYEKCLSMMGEPPQPGPGEIGGTRFHYEVPIETVTASKLESIAAHHTQLPGGAPVAIFPPGIVEGLLRTERFTDASDEAQAKARELLASLVAQHAAAADALLP